MARNQDWKNERQRLKHDLKLHASQNLKWVEILDYYMKRDFRDSIIGVYQPLQDV